MPATVGAVETLSTKAINANHLRGLEGAAAAAYFRSLGSVLDDDGFGFAVCSRRPPLTPFDALCSFAMACCGMHCCCGWSCAALIPMLVCSMLDRRAMRHWCLI